MARQVGELLELRIEKLVATGKALARSDGQVVFLEGVYPGDQIEAEILEAKSDFVRARTVRVLEPGTPRRPSPCAYFDRCGGCDWLDVPDANQLEMSRQMAEDAFSRLQRLEPFPLLGPTPSPDRVAYRRRAQLKVDKGRLGFFERGSRSVAPIDSCIVLVPALQRLLAPLAAMAAAVAELREVHLLAGTDGVAVSLIALSPLSISLEAVRSMLQAHGVTTALLEDGTGRTWGTGSVRITIGELSYHVPAASFFQGNASFDEELVRKVAGSVPQGRVLELYAGVGLFTLPLAASGCEVIAVELDAAACNALRENLKQAGLHGTVVHTDAAGSMERLEVQADTVVVDPPRAGLDRTVRERLSTCNARRIVYLSCDLGTLARDLRALHPRWKVRQIELLDLFPQTAHLESLTILERRDA